MLLDYLHRKFYFQDIGQQAVGTAFTSSKAAVYLRAGEKCHGIAGT